jgi:hypothetical protein
MASDCFDLWHRGCARIEHDVMMKNMFHKAYSKVSILHSPVGSINAILSNRINELASEGQISNIGMAAPHSHIDTRLEK